SAPTALGLVALAGIVAVLATRGLARRAVGAVLFLAGVGLVWRAIASGAAVSESRARTLVTDKHTAVNAADLTPHVATHPIWPALTVVCGLLVLAAGAYVTARGHQWQGMSARYDRTPDAEQRQARAATALWTALDRGDDPTSHEREGT
ncbi:MAG: Trp biosynthesis-associated membrane protein, partial [Actinobacteria bacterium]|nr:Trp biosynthesis-associated membrane protein [Actinomycetota bacterium]